MITDRSLWIRIPMVSFGVINITTSIMILVTLAETPDDCDFSLRNFLLVLDIALAVLGIAIIFVESIGNNCMKSSIGLGGYYTFLAISISVVFVLQGCGMFIIGHDQNCGNTFTDGYELTLYVAMVYFVIGGVMLGLFIFWLLKATLDSRKGYQSLDS